MIGTARSLLALCFAILPVGLGCAGNTDSANEPAEVEANLSAPQYQADPIPPTHDDIASLEGDALKQALLARIKDHDPLGYNGARKQIFAKTATAFQNANGKLECVYTGREVDPTGSTAVGGFNTEHSWPQSLGAGSEPAKSDLHHLFPVDAHANSSRGNFLFGYPVCAQTPDPEGVTHCSFGVGGSFMGKDATGRNVFEVRPEKRGDIARAHFYFSVRYNLRIGSTEEAILRSWSEEDPVDDEERARNAAIQALQNNRNPFVDRPDFVAKISDF